MNYIFNFLGIVSQNLPPSKDYLSPGGGNTNNHYNNNNDYKFFKKLFYLGSYIASSYVKWVEAAGTITDSKRYPFNHLSEF